MSRYLLHWHSGNAELRCHVLVKMIVALMGMNTMQINIKTVGSRFRIVS